MSHVLYVRTNKNKNPGTVACAGEQILEVSLNVCPHYNTPSASSGPAHFNAHFALSSPFLTDSLLSSLMHRSTPPLVSSLWPKERVSEKWERTAPKKVEGKGGSTVERNKDKSMFLWPEEEPLLVNLYYSCKFFLQAQPTHIR